MTKVIGLGSFVGRFASRFWYVLVLIVLISEGGSGSPLCPGARAWWLCGVNSEYYRSTSGEPCASHGYLF